MTFPRKKSGAPALALTSMLDVIFLLLCFFVTVSVFSQWESEISIKLPSAKTGEQPERLPGEIIVNLAKDGTITVNSAKLSLEDLGARLAKVAKFYPGQPVIIRADKFSQTREKKVVSRIKRELAPDSVIVTRDYAVIMVVGEGMAFSSGMLAKATTALAAHGINISMVNQGASEISFMIGIKSEDRDKAVRALYESFFG